MPIQDLGGDKPTDRPAPPPPPPPSFSPNKEQDVAGDRPTNENGPDDEKVVDLDLPPPPNVPPPPPPSFSPDEKQDLGRDKPADDTHDEKVVDLDLPPPPKEPPPPPPSFTPDKEQDLGRDKPAGQDTTVDEPSPPRLEPPSDTLQDVPPPPIENHEPRGPVISQGPITVENVPAYDQTYDPGWFSWEVNLGCVPVAVASVLAYWDENGYDKLFTADGDDLKTTKNVAEEVTSRNHMDKYYDWPKGDSYQPDNLSITDTDHKSIANFLETSVDVQKLGGQILRDVFHEDKDKARLPDGWTTPAQIFEAVPEYAGQPGKGYSFSVWATGLPEWAGPATLMRGFEDSNLEELWGVLKNEIDNRRPLVAGVDANSDDKAQPNHGIPVVGYWEKADGNYYGFYNNWGEEETIQWEKFTAPAIDVAWGVAALYTIAPEPASPIAFDPALFDSALIL